MTKPTGRRMTTAREVELREDLARLDERLSRLENRRDVGEILAEEIGQAALRSLRKPSTKRGSNL